MQLMKTKYLSAATIGVGITLLCVLVGELFRLKGILLLDIWAPLFAGGWLIWKLLGKEFKSMPKLAWPILAFVGIGLASLLINSAEMTWNGFIGSALYGVRWASLALIGLLVMEEKPLVKKIILCEVVVLSVMLALAGFIQLGIAPDFTDYEILGWDPHIGRLLGTWFDPNLLGGWFAVISPVILGLAWDDKKHRKYWIAALAIIGFALLMTLSRSAYLALIAALGIFSLLRSRTLLLGFIILGLLATATLSPIQDRVLSLVDSVESVFTETYSLPDASARHRFGSWEEGWDLFLEKPILGHGYNRYAEAALELGTLKDTEIHSASGSDSSLITVLATTGILGFLPFVTIYALIARWAWAKRKDSDSLGLLSGLAALFVHSVFVNSLLFPLLMAPLWILIGALSFPSRVR
jgi:O-antigen ligase